MSHEAHVRGVSVKDALEVKRQQARDDRGGLKSGPEEGWKSTLKTVLALYLLRALLSPSEF